jgi:hypothetical protein
MVERTTVDSDTFLSLHGKRNVSESTEERIGINGGTFPAFSPSPPFDSDTFLSLHVERGM